MKIYELIETTELAKNIVFANHNQVILYECELSGQISDGHWENASPRDHWKNMTSAQISFSSDPMKQGVFGFHTKRKYHFAAPLLLDAVGDRMLFYVKFYNTYKDVSLDLHDTIDLLSKDYITSLTSSSDSYYEKKVREIMNILHLRSKEELNTVAAKVENFKYSMQDLKKDLKQMSTIVNKGK